MKKVTLIVLALAAIYLVVNMVHGSSDSSSAVDNDLYVTCNSCGGSGTCSSCEGSGLCNLCEGTGIYDAGYFPTFGRISGDCSICKGNGKCIICKGLKECSFCDGKGVKPRR